MLQVLCDLLDLVQQMNVQMAGHTHMPGPSPSPTDSSRFTENAVATMNLVNQLRPITV